MKDMLLSAWRYRYFILSSIQTEFRARFIRSRLGGLWMIIHPLAQAAIFALVLAEMMAARLPGLANNKFAYAIYLMSGMLAWSLFSEVINRCLTLFIDNGNLLKKIVFPRISLPLIVTGSALFNNLLLFMAIIVVFGLLGHAPGVQIAWVPLLMLVTLALALGIGLVLGVLNVFIRDVGQVVPVVLQLGFWFTPIVYAPNIVPEAFRPMLHMNPMTTIVQSYQNAMLFNTTPDFVGLGWLFPAILILLGGAFIMFRRASAEMVDVL
ncbi:MAG: ABC transporter permease [Nitrospirae bacterium]|nr:ABC transporter permease [Nitrospirota bacterium]